MSSRSYVPGFRPAVAHPSADLRTRVLTGADALRRIVSDWDAGMPSGRLGPLTRPAWFGAAATTLAAAAELRLVVAERNGRVVAVAPLVAGPDGCLELLGAAQLPEPCDFAAHDPRALTALVRAVIALRRPLRLPRVPADSLTPPLLRAITGRSGLVVVRPAEPWPTLLLDPEWAHGEGRLSARRASDLRRARRRAAATGTIDVEHHCPTPTTVDALLDRVLNIEAGGWKGRSRTALRYDPVLRAFFIAWARGAAVDGSLRIAILTIAGEDAAVQLAAEASNRRWILKIGHVDAHARCSPGLLLLAETVRDAAQRGLEAVELLGTVEPWTRAWTGEASEALLVRSFPANPAGARRLLRDGRRVAALRMTRAQPHHADRSDG